jgi:hypothetical protein
MLSTMLSAKADIEGHAETVIARHRNAVRSWPKPGSQGAEYRCSIVGDTGMPGKTVLVHGQEDWAAGCLGSTRSLKPMVGGGKTQTKHHTQRVSQGIEEDCGWQKVTRSVRHASSY